MDPLWFIGILFGVFLFKEEIKQLCKAIMGLRFYQISLRKVWNPYLVYLFPLEFSDLTFEEEFEGESVFISFSKDRIHLQGIHSEDHLKRYVESIPRKVKVVPWTSSQSNGSWASPIFRPICSLSPYPIQQSILSTVRESPGRSYLLIGPPNSGKTTTVNIIASRTLRPIYLIHLPEVDNASFFSLMTSVGPKGIILIKYSGEDSTRLTRSGFLSTLNLRNPGVDLFILTSQSWDRLQNKVDSTFSF